MKFKGGEKQNDNTKYNNHNTINHISNTNLH